MNRVRWGVSATARVADRFVAAVREVPEAELVAVGSRSFDRAARFADRHDIAHRHGSVIALGSNDDVDAVYVPSVASQHCADALALISAGKHVLVEKPLASAEADEILAAAKDRGVFVMEAMWSRFLPAYVKLREILATGRIGDVRHVHAELGVPFDQDAAATRRLFDPSLGGGALYDFGVYPLQLAREILGPFRLVTGARRMGGSGVDLASVASVTAERGTASVAVSLDTMLSCTAHITGTAGVIKIPVLDPTHLTVGPVRGSADVAEERIDAFFSGEGMRFELQEVHRCLREGLTESPTMTWTDSRDVLAAIEAVRACQPVYTEDGAEDGRPE